MRLTIAAVGRLKDGPERALMRRYGERIDSAGRALGIGPLTTIEIAESRRASASERCAEEAKTLLGKIGPGCHIVLLDVGGAAYDSVGFARRIASLRETAVPGLGFALGGPDGHGKAMRNAAAETLSLGAMTLPHGLARAVLAEQIYRALTVLAGHPYHRA